LKRVLKSRCPVLRRGTGTVLRRKHSALLRRKHSALLREERRALAPALLFVGSFEVGLINLQNTGRNETSSAPRKIQQASSRTARLFFEKSETSSAHEKSNKLLRRERRALALRKNPHAERGFSPGPSLQT
jgi:hypothetical protein